VLLPCKASRVPWIAVIRQFSMAGLRYRTCVPPDEIYQIAREALRNTLRHAHASRIGVRFVRWTDLAQSIVGLRSHAVSKLVGTTQ
jgi:hypothetical protein